MHGIRNMNCILFSLDLYENERTLKKLWFYHFRKNWCHIYSGWMNCTFLCILLKLQDSFLCRIPRHNFIHYFGSELGVSIFKKIQGVGGVPNFWVLLHLYVTTDNFKKFPNFSGSQGGPDPNTSPKGVD